MERKVVQELKFSAAVVVEKVMVLDNHNLVFWVVRKVLEGKVVQELKFLAAVVVEKVMMVLDNHNLVF